MPWDADRGIYNLEICRALLPQHEVRAVAPIPWLDEVKARRPGRPALPPGRVTVLEGVWVGYPRYFYIPKVLRRLYGTFLWHSIRRFLRNSLADFRPDIVLGYWAHPDGAVAVRYARSVGARVWIMVGGSDVLLLARHGVRRRLILDALRGADGVMPVSRNLRERLVEMGLPGSRIVPFSRGVDRERFGLGPRDEARRRLGLPPGVPLLLWVGRLVPVKGLDVLVTACSRLQAEAPGLQVLLAGSGPLRAALEAQARQAGVAGMIRFLGSVRHEELGEWFRAADAVVLPSLSEGVPNVLLEGHACGVPFVASAVGGVSEAALSGIDRLVPPGDADALASAILATLHAPRPDPAMLAASVPGLADAGNRLIRILSAETCAGDGATQLL